MLNLLSKYLVAILATLLITSWIALGLLVWHDSSLSDRLSTCKEDLAVMANMSVQQEVKIVESKQIEERIKVLTQDKIKIVKEYVYDGNKTECDNAIDSLRLTF